MLMGVISLAVQCVTTLVVTLYRLELFSYRVMGEKADPFVGGPNSAVGLASGRAVGYYLAGGGGEKSLVVFPLLLITGDLIIIIIGPAAGSWTISKYTV